MIITETCPTPRKALMLADLHLHNKPDWRYIWNNDFIEELLAHLSNYIYTDLILMGDVFEVRNNVDSRVINQFLKLVLGWLETKEENCVYWICGQHDSFLPGRATLEGLKYHDRITIIDNDVYQCVYLDKNLWCVPYARSLEDYRTMLAKIPSGATVLTHMPIKEVLINTGATDVDAIELKEFKRFKNVISGDIHHYQDLKNFQYIGATSQLNWKDKGVQGKLGVLNSDLTLTRVPLKHPEHIEIQNVFSLRNIDTRDTKVILKLLSPKIDMKQLQELKKKPNVLDCIWEPPTIEILKSDLTNALDTTGIKSDREIINTHLSQAELPPLVNIDELLVTGTELFENIYEFSK